MPVPHRHPFPEEVSGSGGWVCRTINAQVPTTSQPDPLRQELVVAHWPNGTYRLSPRVHLRFRGTSTVHYALPPPAIAGHPDRIVEARAPCWTLSPRFGV